MKLVNFNQVVQTAANVGVMVGIIFLAVEVRQNQVILEQQFMLDRLAAGEAAFESYSSDRIFKLQNPELARIWMTGLADQNMSRDEMYQFHLMCEERIYTAYTLFLRFNALEQPDGARFLTSELRGLNDQSATFRECWQREREDVLALASGEEFLAVVEAD